MKTASKVLIIRNMVLISIAIVVLLWLSFVKSSLYLIAILGCAIITVIADIALRKLRVAKKSKDLTVIGVLVLLLVDLIAGILILCLKDEDLVK